MICHFIAFSTALAMDPRDPRAYDPLDLLPANTDELITPRRCWEIIFDFCQNQQLANSYGRHLEISDFVTKFNSNLRSILNHVSTEISSRELSPKSFFNFQYFTIVCQAMCASNEIGIYTWCCFNPALTFCFVF